MTVQEIQGLVRGAVSEGGRITARGFGTYARAMPEGVRLVDLRALGAIVAYDPADLTVTVEAGCPFAVLARTLAEHGQWLPIDVPYPEATTIGGMIASGLVGPLRRTYGSIRDQLIGIEWVGGEGALLRSGGRVVKNVAGYDLMKLHVGTRGRYGIVTSATFRVQPRGTTAAPASPSAIRFLDVKPHPDPRVEGIRNALQASLDPAGVFRTYD